MTDFTTLKTQTNAGASVTDASPTWVDMPFGTANNELRICGSGAGAAGTASASWPTFLRPGATAVWPEMWAFTADTTGLKMATYDGTTAHYMQWRINWDNTGTFASAPIISAWGDNTLAAASPGTQPGAQSGSPFVNGQSSDTSSTSYIKGNAYGYGVDTGGTQQTPGSNAGGTMAVTTGTAGAVSPGTGAWLATWQSLQALTQYIQDGVTPKATTSGFWYVVLAFWTGPNMSGGTLLPVLGFQYTWV
jgi:hypothetical protein